MICSNTCAVHLPHFSPINTPHNSHLPSVINISPAFGTNTRYASLRQLSSGSQQQLRLREELKITDTVEAKSSES